MFTENIDLGQWFAKLVHALHCQGFEQSTNDYSLSVYVDDIILTGTDVDAIHNLKAHLHLEFSIKDLGRLNFFLGIKVTQLSYGIFLSQKKFTHEFLDLCTFDITKKASTPLPLNTKLSATKGTFSLILNFIFLSLVSLIFLPIHVLTWLMQSSLSASLCSHPDNHILRLLHIL